MATTKIYSWNGNMRGNIARMAADFANVSYEFVDTPYSELKSESFLAVNCLGKVPVVQTPEGTLTETNAIATYFCRKANMLGTNAFEEAQVQQWLDYINSTFLQNYFQVIGPALGFFEFNEKTFLAGKAALLEEIKYINNYLNHSTYLAGEALSAADIALYAWVAPLFWVLLDEQSRKGFFSLVRWYKHVSSFASVKKYYRAAFMCKKPWFQVKEQKKEGGKKEQPKQQKKEQPKKAAKKEEAVEEVIPKKKGGLDDLPPSSFNFFDFKTLIVNHKDKHAAVAEFWKQFDPQGYSIWHVKYDKYEGEGEKLYLTSNLKDNTLQRLEKFRKYVYGTFGVYGDEGNYEIEGVWCWRGTEIPELLKEQPNFEYHFWNRLDHTNEEHKKMLEDFWCGYELDKDVVNGRVARDVTQFK